MVPGNIVGMLILLGLLYSKMLKLEQVEAMAGFLLDHLGVFSLFLPGVGHSFDLCRHSGDMA